LFFFLGFPPPGPGTTLSFDEPLPPTAFPLRFILIYGPFSIEEKLYTRFRTSQPYGPQMIPPDADFPFFGLPFPSARQTLFLYTWKHVVFLSPRFPLTNVSDFFQVRKRTLRN